MMKLDPVSEVQYGSNGEGNDLDSHGSLTKLKLRSFYDIEGGEQTQIIQDPIEGKEGVDEDLNQSSILVFGGFADELNDA